MREGKSFKDALVFMLSFRMLRVSSDNDGSTGTVVTTVIAHATQESSIVVRILAIMQS